MSILQFIFVSKLLIDFASTQKLVPQKVTVPSFSQYKRCTKTRTSKMYFIFSTKTFLSLTHSHLISCLLLHLSPLHYISLSLSLAQAHSLSFSLPAHPILGSIAIVQSFFSQRWKLFQRSSLSLRQQTVQRTVNHTRPPPI